MRPYGVKRQDRGCCPGHDKFPQETYSNNLSKKAQSRDTKYAHGRERSNIKIKLKNYVKI